MVDWIVLQTKITMYEALSIRQQLNMEVKKGSSHEAFTKEYRESGFTKIGIWVNRNSILADPNEYNHLLLVTVRCKAFSSNGRLDISQITNKLEWITSICNIANRSWELHFAVFRVSIPTQYSDVYMKLLKNGNTLKSVLADREADDFRNPKLLKYESKSMWLDIQDKGNALTVTLSIMYRKIKDLVKSGSFMLKSTNLSTLDGELEKLEPQLWDFYLNKLSGLSDYYAYKSAEQIIDGSSITHKSKEKCESVLKGVAVYKGVEEFCDHFNDKIQKYDFMNIIGSDNVAKKYMKVLDEELGINPVVISRAIAMERKLDRLDNLLKLIRLNSAQNVWDAETEAEKVMDDIPVEFSDDFSENTIEDMPENPNILYGKSISSEIIW